MGESASPAAVDDSLARDLNPHAGFERWLGLGERHELTRFAVLRLLGFVYTAAFASLSWQVLPLIGSRGITPAQTYVASSLLHAGSRWRAALVEPGLFHFVAPTDAALQGFALLGLVLSVAVTLGVTHAGVMLTLWALYRSFVGIGQIWYGYGWELLLLEAGFLAIFASPLRSLGAFPRARWPLLQVWLWRWLALRVMLGAGLIKLRGDPCWTELTCLDFHFETQPLPNPLSALFHALPHPVLAGGVLFNHLCELVLPFGLLGPPRVRAWSGLGMIAFQLTLIASGNLSFLNWLTIVPLLASFDDAQLARVLPWLQRRAARAASTRVSQRVTIALAVMVGLLSIGPVLNMLSTEQRMNAGFEPLMLVNTYGAFGSVGRERYEIVIEGTRDDPRDPDARWLAYELPYKPGDPRRTPGVISPLQPRLDWQLWFAAMSRIQDEPWLVVLVTKLLEGEPALRTLFARDPFEKTGPPRFLRIWRYRYRFAKLTEDASWRRESLELYLPPISLAALRG
jgi:hypothetical protein